MDWFKLAARLSEAETDGVRNDEGQTWVSIVSQETKNNQNMLRRMQKARSFVMHNFDASDGEKLSQMPLSYVDILSRAHVVKRDAAIVLAKELISDQGRFTYRSLLERFNSIRNDNISILTDKMPHKSGVFHFKKRCFEIAADGGMDHIYQGLGYHESLKFRIWKGGHPFVSPHMTCRVSDNKGIATDIHDIDGYDCFMQYRDEARDNPRDRILRSVSEATFFTRLWVMLPADGDRRYEILLEKIGSTNVGIVRVDTTKEKCECTMLPKQSPVPDRRHLWSKHELRYVA